MIWPMSPRSNKETPTLVLIPTPLERDRLESLGDPVGKPGWTHLCGFGPVAAAARTAELLARLQPARVLLIGCAGTHAPQTHPVGTAWRFDSVAIDGIGAGEGDQILGPADLGLPQWTEQGEAVHDRLPLEGGDAGLLLTVCSAAGDEPQAERRRTRFPEARAEDMEAFGVALACHLARVPLTVVRGISNAAGVRDKGEWQLDEALTNALALAREGL
ncbi:MAG: futalosine hydrolase [Planctomycetes bacterium]|nr:futalosine hydrolase [Planctomycetota bacterium]